MAGESATSPSSSSQQHNQAAASAAGGGGSASSQQQQLQPPPSMANNPSQPASGFPPPQSVQQASPQTLGTVSISSGASAGTGPTIMPTLSQQPPQPSQQQQQQQQQQQGLQPLTSPSASAPQLHSTQSQAFASPTLAAASSQMNYQQPQTQKQTLGVRGQFPSGQLNPASTPQQVPSPLVQSPPGNPSIPRGASALRLPGMSQGTSGGRATPVGAQYGSTMGSPAASSAHLIAAQRAGQVQGAARPTQMSPTMQQTQHMSIQQQQLASGTRGAYAQYPGQLPTRPPMGGQVVHPPPIQIQQHLSGHQTQYTSQQQAQARQKQGQYPTTTSAPQMQMGMMSAGTQMIRTPTPQQQQRLQTGQVRPSQQQQQQQQQSQQISQQQQPLSSPQKLQAQQLQGMPSSSAGLQASVQSPGTMSSQVQQQWMQKSIQQQAATAVSYQGMAQQKQTHTQYSQQLLQQQQQAGHLSQSTQQQQLARVQPSPLQRPPTPTGMQSSTLVSGRPSTSGGSISQPPEHGNRILGKRSIQELVAQVDPNERLDPEVEDILLEIADDFIESVTTFACKLAKHRKSNILEVKDVLLHLSRNWDLNIPGFGGEEYRAYKKTPVNEAHKQRLALIKKSLATQQSVQESAAARAPSGAPVSQHAGPQAPAVV